MNKSHIPFLLLIPTLIILLGLVEPITFFRNTVPVSNPITSYSTSIKNFKCEVSPEFPFLKICKDSVTNCEYLSHNSSYSSFILIQGTCKNEQK